MGAAADALPEVVAAAVDLRPWVVLPGMVDTHAHLPQLPNAGLGFALDLLTWLDRVTFPTERSWSDPAVAERLAPRDLRGVRGRRDDDRPGLRRRLRSRHGRGVPRRRSPRHPGDPRQGDDGSRDLRPDDRAVDDPRALDARIGRPDRPLARRRRRPPRVRRHAAIRDLVHARHAARVGGPRSRDRRRGGRPTYRRIHSRSPRSAASSPRPATTWTSTTVPAVSGSGPSSPTPSTSRTGSSGGSSRPARGSPTVRRRTCSSAPGSCRSRAISRPASRSGSGPMCRAGPRPRSSR